MDGCRPWCRLGAPQRWAGRHLCESLGLYGCELAVPASGIMPEFKAGLKGRRGLGHTDWVSSFYHGSKSIPRIPQQSLLVSYWPELCHMATPSCKGGWALEYFVFVDSIIWEENREGGGNRSQFNYPAVSMRSNNADNNHSPLPECLLRSHHKRITWHTFLSLNVHYNRSVRDPSLPPFYWDSPTFGHLPKV